MQPHAATARAHRFFRDARSGLPLAALLHLLAPAGGCASGGDPPRTAPPRAALPDVLSFPLRPTDGRALFHYDADSEVTSFAPQAGKIRVHYATVGRHATILDDVDGSGTPDFVEMVASAAEEVLAFWAERGYRPPVGEEELHVADDGGDGLFDIYLVDFDISADGHFATDACTGGFPRRCAGHMVMENDFTEQGYRSLRLAVNILTSHELFHAIQAAYAADVSSWWSEATAVWAEEEFDPAQDDFEAFLDGFFSRPERSLDSPLPGPVDPFSYGLAIFPRFLGERYGVDTVRRVWEALALAAGPPPADGGGPDPAAAIDQVLQQEQASSLSAAYGEFAVHNLFTGARADPARGYAEGRRYPQVALEQRASLPWQGDFRLFHLASRYLSLRTGGLAEVAAALVGGEPGQLQLALLAQQADGSAGALAVGDPAAAPGTVLRLATDGAGTVLVAASNVRIAGQSVRPLLCAGTMAEVESCLQAASPQADAGADTGADCGEAADAGETADAGTSPDGSPDAGPDAGTPQLDDAGGAMEADAAADAEAGQQPVDRRAGAGGDGGCALAGTGSPGSGWSCAAQLLLFALLPVLLHPRRRGSRTPGRWIPGRAADVQQRRSMSSPRDGCSGGLRR